MASQHIFQSTTYIKETANVYYIYHCTYYFKYTLYTYFSHVIIFYSTVGVAVFSNRHQGAAEPDRANPGQKQQGHHRLQYHVRGWVVPPVSAGLLEVPQNRHPETFRVYARDPPRGAGHGLRHIPQDCREL